MEVKQFKIRASQASKLLTNGKGKDTMGETAKSYLKEWLVSEITGKGKEVKSKYLERGKELEEIAILRVAIHYDCHLEKNTENLENDFFTGTYDCKNDERVIDTKVPFDCFTFPFFITEVDFDYYVQLQVYMNLTGLKKASLAFCLEDGSHKQIESLSWFIAKDKDKDEPDIEEWDEAELKLSYRDLPSNLRLKVFEFEYDAEIIEKLEKRVLEAREYIEKELIPMLNL